MAFQESTQQSGKMRWDRLEKNLCPKCTSRKMLTGKDGKIVCGAGCGFVIGEQRMQEIVSSMIGEDIDEDDDLDYALCTFCGSPLCDGTC